MARYNIAISSTSLDTGTLSYYLVTKGGKGGHPNTVRVPEAILSGMNVATAENKVSEHEAFQILVEINKDDLIRYALSKTSRGALQQIPDFYYGFKNFKIN